MKELIGKKIGMTRIFRETGEAVPATVLEVGPCSVIGRKTVERDGYQAWQVGFGERHEKRVSKPMAGQFASANVKPTQCVREIQYDDSELEIGSELKAGIFAKGERVDVTGTSRGLGFAGTMKRHGFSGGNKTHGQSDRWRAPGSLGQSSYPSRVFKGKPMAGKLGNDRVTVLNLEIVDVIEDENLILVRGAVPGTRGSLVKLRFSNRKKVARQS